jgi:hypothetical protein
MLTCELARADVSASGDASLLEFSNNIASLWDVYGMQT